MYYMYHSFCPVAISYYVVTWSCAGIYWMGYERIRDHLLDIKGSSTTTATTCSRHSRINQYLIRYDSCHYLRHDSLYFKLVHHAHRTPVVLYVIIFACIYPNMMHADTQPPLITPIPVAFAAGAISGMVGNN